MPSLSPSRRGCFGWPFEPDRQTDEPGLVGQITANSFMKREFGKKLVEQFFPIVQLTHVIDTSGAYIPGHGTPTVILVGRNHIGRKDDKIRAVLGIRGEPSQPADPCCGPCMDGDRRLRSVKNQRIYWVTTRGHAARFYARAPVGPRRWWRGACNPRDREARRRARRTHFKLHRAQCRVGADEIFMRPLCWFAASCGDA